MPEKKTFGQGGRGFSQVGSHVGSEPGASSSLGPHTVPARKSEPSAPIGSLSSSLLSLILFGAAVGLALTSVMVAKRIAKPTTPVCWKSSDWES